MERRPLPASKLRSAALLAAGSSMWHAFYCTLPQVEAAVLLLVGFNMLVTCTLLALQLLC
jgi:hypothetical protein